MGLNKEKKKTSSRDLFKTAKTNGSPRMLTGGCLRDSRTKKWHHLPPSFSPFFPSSLPPFLPLFLSLSLFFPPSGENQHPLLPRLDSPLCSRGCPGAPHCWRAGAAQRLQASEQLYLLRRSGNQKQIAMFSEAGNPPAVLTSHLPPGPIILHTVTWLLSPRSMFKYMTMWSHPLVTAKPHSSLVSCQLGICKAQN